MAEIQIVGPPGTGKTSTLAALVERGIEEYGSDAVVVSSLTKTAASELSGRGLRIPREHAGTLHSLCYRQIGRPPLVYGALDEWNRRHPGMRLSTRSATPENDAPESSPTNNAPGDELDQAYGLLRHRLVPRDLIPAGLRQFVSAWEEFKSETGTIDYTDMIEMAYEGVPTAPGAPSAILADEVQDYSRLETSLLRKWGAAARTLVLAGDPDQAIYEWRGADPAVFLDHDVGPNRRILAQSYRVPRKVHAAATSWVRQIKARIDAEYRPRDEDGVVRREPGMRWKYPEAMLRDIERWVAAGESVIVEATCDYMLAPTLSVLRREGIPFGNPWRRANGAWNPLVSGRGVTMAQRVLAFLRPDVDGQWWSAEDLRRWTAVLRVDGVLRHGAKAAIDRLGTGAAEAVPWDALAGWLEDDALARATDLDLDWWRRSLLATRAKAADYPIVVQRRRGVAALAAEPLVHVGTIHSFKGAEADHVVLFPDVSPQGMRQWQGPQAGRDAVVRQFYVGMTRARSTLVLAGPSSPYAVPWGLTL